MADKTTQFLDCRGCKLHVTTVRGRGKRVTVFNGVGQKIGVAAVEDGKASWLQSHPSVPPIQAIEVALGLRERKADKPKPAPAVSTHRPDPSVSAFASKLPKDDDED